MNNQIETKSQFTPDVTERTIPEAENPNYALKIAILGIMTALETVATILLSIYIPATQGYFNLGDGIIYITAILFGSYIGGFAGGFGAALADIILGYSVYAPITLVVKGLQGFVVGWIYHKFASSKQFGGKLVYKILAIVCGAPIMIGGYFFAQYFMLGYGGAVGELPFNLLQALLGMALAIPVTVAIEQVPQMTQITSMLNVPNKK